MNTALLSAKVISAERDERGLERKDATTWSVVVLLQIWRNMEMKISLLCLIETLL